MAEGGCILLLHALSLPLPGLAVRSVGPTRGHFPSRGGGGGGGSLTHPWPSLVRGGMGPGTGPSMRREGVYTPIAHEGAMRRGDGPESVSGWGCPEGVPCSPWTQEQDLSTRTSWPVTCSHSSIVGTVPCREAAPSATA